MSGVALQRGDRLGAALGDDDVGVAALEQRRHGEDVAEVVVDHEDLQPVERCCPRGAVDSLPSSRRDRRARRRGSSAQRSAGRAGVRGSVGQPGPQGGEQLGGVDRLGHVVVGAGVEAALALAGHRLAGDRDDRRVT